MMLPGFRTLLSTRFFIQHHKSCKRSRFRLYQLVGRVSIARPFESYQFRIIKRNTHTQVMLELEINNLYFFDIIRIDVYNRPIKRMVLLPSPPPFCRHFMTSIFYSFSLLLNCINIFIYSINLF